jgi:hypothetical protein
MDPEQLNLTRKSMEKTPAIRPGQPGETDLKAIINMNKIS